MMRRTLWSMTIIGALAAGGCGGDEPKQTDPGPGPVTPTKVALTGSLAGFAPLGAAALLVPLDASVTATAINKTGAVAAAVRVSHIDPSFSFDLPVNEDYVVVFRHEPATGQAYGVLVADSASGRTSFSLAAALAGTRVRLGEIAIDRGHGVAWTFDTVALPAALVTLADGDDDGIADVADLSDDEDGDAVDDVADSFPFDATETVDTDSDGRGNNADLDDDNDAHPDLQDRFPTDATEFEDTDNDGTGDNHDADDDGDFFTDAVDAFPKDAAEHLDTDGDRTGDNADSDDDNDGFLDAADALPLDANEHLDTDLDGIGNNADVDDDGDLVADLVDAFPLEGVAALDSDGDGAPDAFVVGASAAEIAASGLTQDAFPTQAIAARDTDNDGAPDAFAPGATAAEILASGLTQDAFPANPAEQLDTDADGAGNNADTDDDGDGILDLVDALPLNNTRFAAFPVVAALAPLAGGVDTAPAAITVNGLIAGNSESAAGTAVSAVTWSVGLDGVATAPAGLPALPGVPAQSFSAAFGANVMGHVVGQALNAAGVLVAVMWDAAGATELLGLGGRSSFSAAYDVNDQGWIAGESENVSFEPHAVIWVMQADGSVAAPFDVGVVAGEFASTPYSSARAINLGGIVVGEAQAMPPSVHAGVVRAVAWKVSATDLLAGPVDLGTLPGHESATALSVNESGVIVGESMGQNGAVHAVRWRVDPITAALIAGPVDLGPTGSASDVTNAGRICGAQLDTASVWDVAAIPANNADPVTAVVAQTAAMSINEAGQVVGIDAGVGFVATP
ncbi:MAG: thrombospondin type 3 repeat-containing protein [Deltaproteobacteria bacterium]|nr:thrombospondin type 3 repeat-containing protein [Deltaproteobacteria bacterium]